MRKSIIFVVCFILLFSLGAEDAVGGDQMSTEYPFEDEETASRVSGNYLLFNIAIKAETGDLAYGEYGMGFSVKLNNLMALAADLGFTPSWVSSSEFMNPMANVIMGIDTRLSLRYMLSDWVWVSGGVDYRRLYESYYLFRDNMGIPASESDRDDLWVLKSTIASNYETKDFISTLSFCLGYRFGGDSPFFAGVQIMTAYKAQSLIKNVLNIFSGIGKFSFSS